MGNAQEHPSETTLIRLEATSCLGVERGREGGDPGARALRFNTGDLNEECCTAVFHGAQRKGLCKGRGWHLLSPETSVYSRMKMQQEEAAEQVHDNKEKRRRGWAPAPAPGPVRDGGCGHLCRVLQLDSLLDAIMSVLHSKQFGNPSLNEGSQKKRRKASRTIP